MNYLYNNVFKQCTHKLYGVFDKHGEGTQYGEGTQSSPSVASMVWKALSFPHPLCLAKTYLDYIPKASHQDLFPYLSTSSY